MGTAAQAQRALPWAVSLHVEEGQQVWVHTSEHIANARAMGWAAVHGGRLSQDHGLEVCWGSGRPGGWFCEGLSTYALRAGTGDTAALGAVA